MQALNCPNCGAPAHVAAGQPVATCTFCKQTFQVPGYVPPAPPPQQVIRQIIVVPPEPAVQSYVEVARVARGFSAIFAVIPIIVLAIGGAVAFSAMRSATSALGGSSITNPFAKTWTGSEPLVCGGNDQVTASDVVVSYTAGPGISAGGNCRVKCARCRIKAPMGVEADGNAEVVLVDSHVEGSEVGITASGNADVKLIGNSTLTGKQVKNSINAHITAPQSAGGATVEDAGVTLHHSPVTPSKPPPRPSAAH